MHFFWTVHLKRALGVMLVGIMMLWGAAVLYLPARSVFSKEEVELPIVMYHHMLKDSSRWGKYVISPDLFRQDLEYLKAQGYETVTTEDVISYAYNGTPLPPKPIMLTFDDGYYSNYLYACPLLKEYGMTGVLSIIGRYTDSYSQTQEENANYSHVTWQRCREMMEEGTMELQNHTYNLHSLTENRRGCGRRPGENKDAYQAMLKQDLEQLQQRFFQETGTLPRAFTYPFGQISPEAEPVIRELGFLAAFTCNEGRNVLSPGDKEQLYQLKRYLRPSGIDSASYFQKILPQ